MPQAQSIIEGLLEEATKYNRIYVTSIHSDLTENDIQRYLSRGLRIVLFEQLGRE